MNKFLFVLFLGLMLHLKAAAQDNPSYASAKESRKEKKMSKSTSAQKDRNYWQDPRNVKKFKKTAKKKDCDCPGEMTAKQRRKHRIR
jgi:hypothetical protein